MRTGAERADATPVALMDGKQLIALLMEHEIGVQRETFELFELDVDDEDDEG